MVNFLCCSEWGNINKWQPLIVKRPGKTHNVDVADIIFRGRKEGWVYQFTMIKGEKDSPKNRHSKKEQNFAHTK